MIRAPLLLMLTAACASHTGATDPDTTVSPLTMGVVGINGTTNIETRSSSISLSTIVPVAPDSAYALLKAAYAKLEIPVAQLDASQRSIGNDVLKVRRHLAGLTMQTVVDCGEKIGIANAETWDIQMNILSFVVPDGKGGSKVSTRIQALGHDPTVSDRDLSPCTTRGDLEAKIGNTVKLLFVKKQ
jgi:hypothetical protein